MNWAAPSGDLGSPFFGQYRSLGGGFRPMGGSGNGTYNRKVDVQVRFAFYSDEPEACRTGSKLGHG